MTVSKNSRNASGEAFLFTTFMWHFTKGKNCRRIPMQAAAAMKVAQISKPHGEFEIAERPIPESGPGQVLIKVQACGVCHSDVLTKEGWMPLGRLDGRMRPSPNEF
jgi:hypothetical protein